jgi:hypothetical protein
MPKSLLQKAKMLFTVMILSAKKRRQIAKMLFVVTHKTF